MAGHLLPLIDQPGELLDYLLDAIGRRDLAAAVACFKSGAEPLLLGSKRGEQARGTEAIENFLARAFEKPKPYTFEFPTRAVTIVGDAAWIVAAGQVIEPPAATGKPYRLVVVFVRQRGEWRITLWSGSEPVQPIVDMPP